MARSGKRREARRAGLIQTGVAAAGAAIAQNPAIAGGATAFMVTFFFVSANALWYQPYPHKSAFFATRDLVSFPAPALAPDEQGTTIVIEREPPAADPLIERAQRALAELDLYAGPVDGLQGPQTRRAVEEYQRIMGVEVTGEVSDGLLRQMEAGPATTPALAPAQPSAPSSEETGSVVPIPIPAPRGQVPAPQAQEAVLTASTEPVAAPSKSLPDPRIARVQAGLRAFGNDGIEIDGLMGAKTRAAIREFQSLFGLPVTGEVDDGLYAKMRDVGLTN